MNDKFDHVLVNEETLATEDYVDSLEESYLLSCQHNGVSSDDPEYFRRYVWNLIAMIGLRLQKRREGG